MATQGLGGGDTVSGGTESQGKKVSRGRDRRVVVALSVLGLIFAIIGVVVAYAMITWQDAAGAYPYRLEAYKTILQLLLVTGLGGILVVALGLLRDQEAERARAEREQEATLAREQREAEAERGRAQREEEARLAREQRENEARQAHDQREAESKRDVRIAALQALDRDLGGVYRALKAVKRQLRTHLLSAARDDKGRAGPPYEFPAEAFRRCMADLLVAQIRAEDLRSHIVLRTDLFDGPAIEAMRGQLRYATRFFHDVHEDIERGKVRFIDERCIVDARCCNIDSLLNSRSFPDDLPAAVIAALTGYRGLKRETSTLEERQAAIDEIDRARRLHDPGKRRFRMIADDCFALVHARIRAAIRPETDAPDAEFLSFEPHRSYDDPVFTQAAG